MNDLEQRLVLSEEDRVRILREVEIAKRKSVVVGVFAAKYASESLDDQLFVLNFIDYLADINEEVARKILNEGLHASEEKVAQVARKKIRGVFKAGDEEITRVYELVERKLEQDKGQSAALQLLSGLAALPKIDNNRVMALFSQIVAKGGEILAEDEVYFLNRVATNPVFTNEQVFSLWERVLSYTCELRGLDNVILAVCQRDGVDENMLSQYVKKTIRRFYTEEKVRLLRGVVALGNSGGIRRERVQKLVQEYISEVPRGVRLGIVVASKDDLLCPSNKLREWVYQEVIHRSKARIAEKIGALVKQGRLDTECAFSYMDRLLHTSHFSKREEMQQFVQSSGARIACEYIDHCLARDTLFTYGMQGMKILFAIDGVNEQWLARHYASGIREKDTLKELSDVLAEVPKKITYPQLVYEGFDKSFACRDRRVVENATRALPALLAMPQRDEARILSYFREGIRARQVWRAEQTVKKLPGIIRDPGVSKRKIDELLRLARRTLKNRSCVHVTLGERILREDTREEAIVRLRKCFSKGTKKEKLACVEGLINTLDRKKEVVEIIYPYFGEFIEFEPFMVFLSATVAEWGGRREIPEEQREHYVGRCILASKEGRTALMCTYLNNIGTAVRNGDVAQLDMQKKLFDAALLDNWDNEVGAAAVRNLERMAKCAPVQVFSYLQQVVPKLNMSPVSKTKEQRRGRLSVLCDKYLTEEERAKKLVHLFTSLVTGEGTIPGRINNFLQVYLDRFPLAQDDIGVNDLITMVSSGIVPHAWINYLTLETTVEGSRSLRELIDCASLSIPGYQVLSRLGEGSSARVYLVRSEKEGLQKTRFALKVFNKGVENEQEFANADRLLAIPGGYRGHFLPVIPQAGVQYEDKLVTAFLMPHGGKTLREVMNDHWSPKDILSIGRQLVEIVRGLRGADEVHGDLRPENLFVDKSGWVTIGDYGIVMQSKKYDFKHNRRYGAPKEYTGWSPDFFSVGLIVYELCTGEHLILPRGDNATTTTYAPEVERAITGEYESKDFEEKYSDKVRRELWRVFDEWSDIEVDGHSRIFYRPLPGDLCAIEDIMPGAGRQANELAQEMRKCIDEIQEMIVGTILPEGEFANPIENEIRKKIREQERQKRQENGQD